MNSALKPVLSASSPQNPPVTTQLNKSMHPQSTPTTYGQPSTHMPQSLVNLPHNNPTVSHSHPNPAHQTNHYSLNVPNAFQHYVSNNPSTIPASNHPVPNVSQAATTGPTYSPNKNNPFTGGYQPNLGHPPNVNPLPPVTQTLPATQPPHHTPNPPESIMEKPQSNGTPEIKSPTKPETQENHVSLPRDKSPVPPASPKMCEKHEEKAIPLPTLELKHQKVEVVKEENTPSLPESAVPSDTSAIANVAQPVQSEPSVTEAKKERETTKQERELHAAEAVESTGNAQDLSSVPKSKDKESQKGVMTARSTTLRTPTRKAKTSRPDGDSPKANRQVSDARVILSQKSPCMVAKSKRTRTKTQPYQSPLPEIEIIAKISSSTPKTKANDDKLIVFYKNEFLAVRNSEGSFYICQAVQNIYKTSPKIRIRWLSQDKSDKSGEVYTPDFYDNTDFDCILTNLNLVRVDKGKYKLPPAEKERTDSILKRSLAVEKGEVSSPSLTEEHPDGIDLSLYKEESQLKKRRAIKRKASSTLKANKKSNITTSPDQSKVCKLSAKTTRKVMGRRMSAVAAKQPKKMTPAAVSAVAVPLSAEIKKPVASSRSDRAKRRSDNQNHNKVSPVVDQKKARVLAKVARKGVVNTNSKSQSVTKNTNTSKTLSSSSKVQKMAPRAAIRKTKRSSRK